MTLPTRAVPSSSWEEGEHEEQEERDDQEEEKKKEEEEEKEERQDWEKTSRFERQWSTKAHLLEPPRLGGAVARPGDHCLLLHRHRPHRPLKGRAVLFHLVLPEPSLADEEAATRGAREASAEALPGHVLRRANYQEPAGKHPCVRHHRARDIRSATAVRLLFRESLDDGRGQGLG